ncbi:MAG: CD1871A family CXXC motif-containing protein [Desulfocapsaceae bacterium]|nr:CD1871A family CXXC motif-containing protein [Desulfocapsaceae bacterium]
MTKKNSIPIYRFIPLIFFVILFLTGIALNEPQRVLEQAWNICLECVGIG